MVDYANVVNATDEKFGTGDGDRAVFPLTYGGSEAIRVVEVDAIYKDSWEGHQKLSDAIRTQFCTVTEDFTPWRAFNTKGDLAKSATVNNPDGTEGAWNLSIGSLVVMDTLGPDQVINGDFSQGGTNWFGNQDGGGTNTVTYVPVTGGNPPPYSSAMRWAMNGFPAANYYEYYSSSSTLIQLTAGRKLTVRAWSHSNYPVRALLQVRWFDAASQPISYSSSPNTSDFTMAVNWNQFTWTFDSPPSNATQARVYIRAYGAGAVDQWVEWTGVQAMIGSTGVLTSSGGFREPTFNHYPASPSYVQSIWMKADAPTIVTMLFNERNSGNQSKQVLVGTEWALYTRPQALAVSPPTTDGYVIAINRTFGTNAALPDGSRIYFAFPQMEISADGSPTSYISNPSSQPLQVPAQYRLQNQKVIFPISDLPEDGEVLSWDGRLILDSAIPFGPNLSIDIKGGVTWRFDQSKNLNSLLDQKQKWLTTNHAQFWNNWFTQTFNLKTASTFGVSVWAYILAVPLTALSLREGLRYWGFGPLRENFNTTGQMPMNPTSGNFPPVDSGGGSGIISPREKVQALRLRYYELTGPATISAINAMLQDVFFEDGIAYIQDNEDMTATYVFNFPLSSFFQSAMLKYGLLPKPAGVKLFIQSI